MNVGDVVKCTWSKDGLVKGKEYEVLDTYLQNGVEYIKVPGFSLYHSAYLFITVRK